MQRRKTVIFYSSGQIRRQPQRKHEPHIRPYQARQTFPQHREHTYHHHRVKKKVGGAVKLGTELGRDMRGTRYNAVKHIADTAKRVYDKECGRQRCYEHKARRTSYTQRCQYIRQCQQLFHPSSMGSLRRNGPRRHRMPCPYIFAVRDRRSSLLRNKDPAARDRILCGAGGGGRTRTSVKTRDFESRASANSATPAYCFIAAIKSLMYYTTPRDENQDIIPIFRPSLFSIADIFAAGMLVAMFPRCGM